VGEYLASHHAELSIQPFIAVLHNIHVFESNWYSTTTAPASVNSQVINHGRGVGAVDEYDEEDQWSASRDSVGQEGVRVDPS